MVGLLALLKRIGHGGHTISPIPKGWYRLLAGVMILALSKKSQDYHSFTRDRSFFVCPNYIHTPEKPRKLSYDNPPVRSISFILKIMLYFI
jgi:hypothetical protein